MLVRSVPVGNQDVPPYSGSHTRQSNAAQALKPFYIPPRFSALDRFEAPSKTPQPTGLHRVWQPVRHFVARTLGLAKPLEWLEAVPATIRKQLAVHQYRREILPLLHQAQDLRASTHVFPVAIKRAQLIRNAAKNAFEPYDKLQGPEHPNVGKTLRKYVDSEATAYLTSHLLALETAIVAKGKKLHLENPEQTSKAISIGLDDAEDIVVRRVRELFYGKDTRPIDDRLYNLILDSPKVVLHEHYRGCSPMALIRAWFMEKHEEENAYKKIVDLKEYCRTDRLFTEDGTGPLYEPDLNRFRLKNDNLVCPSIHSDDTAYLGAYMYTLRLGLENVRYFEYRLNPLSSCVKDPIVFTRSIQQGLDDAKDFLKKATGKNIDGNLIFSADRQPKVGVNVEVKAGEPYDGRVKLAMDVLKAAIEARKQGLRVNGFDIQGDEANYAITDFAPVARELRAYNQSVVDAGRPEMRIGATIHAGETRQSGLTSHPNKPLSGAESVAKTIELFWDKNTPVRIGHGIRIEDELNTPWGRELIRSCREKKIGFEHCPKSNVQTGAVKYYNYMPTLLLSRPVDQGGYGLLVSVSSDNRTTSNTNACNEMVKITRHLGARHEDRKRLQDNGMKTAFIFNPIQQRGIWKEMQVHYQGIEKRYSQIIEDEKDSSKFDVLMGNAS